MRSRVERPRRCRRRRPSAGAAAARRLRPRRARSRPGDESPAPTVLRGTIGGGVAIQLPVGVDQDGARGAEGDEHRADTAVDELVGGQRRPAPDHLGRQRLPVPAAEAPTSPASSSALGLMRSGAARPKPVGQARSSGRSEVSTATWHGVARPASRRRRRTSRRAPPAAAIRTAPPMRRARRCRRPSG